MLLAMLLAGCASTSTAKTPTSATSSPTTDPGSNVDWPVFGFDSARSSVNSHETALTPQTVAGLHQIWSAKLPGVADGSPVYLHGLKLANGSTADVLYVTTRGGQLAAVNAAN